MEQGFQVLLQVFGGLALFLYGTDSLCRAVQQGAGRRLRSLLARCTANPAAGLLNYVPSHAPIYVIDPKPVAGIHGRGRVHHLMKGASEGVEELMACLEK